jgi:Domain of unknown function (DUF2341)/Concanavalin A-like lectin/glucanases superfamily
MTKTPIKNHTFTCGILLFAVWLCCTRLSLTGGGTEDVNARAIAGKIMTSDGAPASETAVRLCPAYYNPVADSLLSITFLDTTDEKGAYRFIKLDTGTYCLQAVQNRDRTRLLVENIHVTADSITTVSTGTLLRPGNIKIMLPDSFDAQTGYVYVPGTAIKSFIRNTTGFAEIDSVPAGTISTLYYGAKKTTPYSIRDTLKVSPGDSLTFSMGPWTHSMKVYLNTSSSGANINKNVFGFPVLVRLTKSTTLFDFSQARSNGEDVRFLKSDNTFLRYEIERWDAAQAQAQLWVRIDTIAGNNTTQCVTMCWGNPSAASHSNGAGVFDTLNNFSGVWHLNENPANGPNSVKDRTFNKHDASPDGGMDVNNSTDGIIGKGIRFDGVKQYLMIKRPVQDDFTIAFWMRADSASRIGTQWWQGDGLVDGDINAADPQNDFGVTYLNNRPVFGTCCPDTTVQADVMVNDAKWHYVVAARVKSSGLKTIYVDGKAAGSQVGTTNSLTGPDSLCFGKVLANITYFKGSLDEIQISNTPRPPEWVMLNYMNQNVDQNGADKLVVFKP